MSNLPLDLANLSALIADFTAKYASVVYAQLVFHTLDDLRADAATTGTLVDGAIVRVLQPVPHHFVKVAGGTVHATSAAGAQFRVRMDRTSPLFFEAAGDGVADDTAAFGLVNESDALEVDLAGRTYRVSGAFVPLKPMFNGLVIDDTETHDFRLLTEARLATPAEALAGLPAGKLVTLEGLAAAVAQQVAAASVPNVAHTAARGSVLYPAAATVEISALNTSIVTTKANSRVRVSLSVSYERDHQGVFVLTRNGVEILSNTQASPGSRNIGIAPVAYDGSVSGTLSHLSLDLIDTVGAAGAYDYRLSVKGSTQPFALNRTIDDTDTANFERASSFVILQELPV